MDLNSLLFRGVGSRDPAREQVLHLNLGIVYENLNRLQVAQEEYQAAASGPTVILSEDARYRLACLLYSLGSLQASAKCLFELRTVDNPELMRKVNDMLSLIADKGVSQRKRTAE